MRLNHLTLGGACLLLIGAAGLVDAASLSSSDRAFLSMAAKTDMTEAHEGQLSANQATRDDVKSFAQALVRDHTEAYTELSQLAQKDGVPIPTGIDSGKNREIVQLQHLKGARFDHEFISYEIADHQHALAAFKKEAAHGQDPDVKAYAAKMVPILENHLHQAEECARTGKRT